MIKEGGLTLAELMIGVAIVAIVLSVGTPSFNNAVRINRIATLSNDLITAMHVARSEAVKLGRTVRVCSSTNGTSCAGSTAWQTGWIVLDPGNNVARSWAAENTDLTLTGPAAAIRYSSSGFVSASATFQIRTSSGTCEQGRDIALSVTGHPSVNSPSCP
jgi:type IV fimbrial biogenesis protein FimT